MINQDRKFKLHWGQSSVMDAKQRYLAMLSGTGGGKTALGSIWAMRNFDLNPGPAIEDSGIICAPSYKVLEQSTLLRFFEFFPPGQAGTWNKQKGEFIPYNSKGAKIFLRSMDKPESIEGIVARWIWADEAALMKRMAWTILQGRVGFKMGKILLTTTIKGMNWIYNDVFLKYKDGKPDYYAIQFASIANPAYPKEEFERARREMDPRTFKMRYLAQFEKMEGLIFPDVNYCDPLPIGNTWKVWTSGDFGFTASHATAIYWHADSGERIYTFAEYYKTGRLMREIAQGYADICSNQYRPDTFFFDPSAQQEAAELESIFKHDKEFTEKYPWLSQIKFKNAFNKVDLGIDAVQTAIKTKRWWIVKSNCPNLADELETYARDEKENIIKVYDDGCDSARYGIASYTTPSSQIQENNDEIFIGEL